jgi:hypothetical protein
MPIIKEARIYKMKKNYRSIGGLPIFQKANMECKYFCDFSREEKFDECTCPIARVYLQKNNYGSIINCPTGKDECPIMKSQNEKDIEFIEKYINKFYEGGWVHVSKKHVKLILEKKLALNSKKYLLLLFNYFGFRDVKDDNLVDGIVFNNLKIKVD